MKLSYLSIWCCPQPQIHRFQCPGDTGLVFFLLLQHPLCCLCYFSVVPVCPTPQHFWGAQWPGYNIFYTWNNDLFMHRQWTWNSSGVRFTSHSPTMGDSPSGAQLHTVFFRTFLPPYWDAYSTRLIPQSVALKPQTTSWCLLWDPMFFFLFWDLCFLHKLGHV